MYEEIIKNRIEQFSPEYRKFVLGDFIEATTRTYSEAFSLDEERAIIFENGLMLYLLMIINQQKLVEFMHQECDFTLKSSQKIVSDIVANLPPSLVYAIHQSYEELDSATTEPAEESPETPRSSQTISSVTPLPTTTSEMLNQAWQPDGQQTPTPQPAPQAPVPPKANIPTSPSGRPSSARLASLVPPPLPNNPAPSVVTPTTTQPSVATWQPVGKTVPQTNSTSQTTPPSAATIPPPDKKPPQSVVSQAVSATTQQDILSRMPPLPEEHAPTPPVTGQSASIISPPPTIEVQPVRTMHKDIERIHGYAAYRQQYPHLSTPDNATESPAPSPTQTATTQRAPVVETPRFDETRG